MIEVFPCGNGWRWRMISADGRTLLESAHAVACSFAAADQAKAWRVEFWARACRIDHRMGACI